MNEDFTFVGVDQYGGLCTLMEKSDLPVGLSPACRNVEFFPGGVQSRYGITAITYTGGGVYPAPTVPSGQIMSVFNYVSLDGTRRVLFLDTNGALWSWTAGATGVLTCVTYGLGQGLRAKALSFFGRCYFTLHDGKHGVGHARQWDGTNLDPISQQGPAVLPNARSLDGTGGYPDTAGNISAGKHDYVVVYETRNGYLTQCSVTTADHAPLDAVASKAIRFWNIPVGPDNVVRRRIYFSPVRIDPNVNATEFYTTSNFWINDNVTTSADLVGESDAVLITGDPLGNIPLRQPLPPTLGLEAYNRRLVAYGFLTEIPRLLSSTATAFLGVENTNFDASGVNHDKWTFVSGAGKKEPTIKSNGVSGAANCCLAFTSDATATTLGYVDSAQWMSSFAATGEVRPQLDYYVRVRMKKSFSATISDEAFFSIYSGFHAGETQIHVNDITMDWAWYSGKVVAFGDAGNDPLQLAVYGADHVPNGESIYVDAVEFYPASTPYSGSLVYVSDPDDPETFDAETGLLQVSENDGQEVRSAFQLRGNLYFVKERGLYVTSDNGDVPSTWRIDQVSDLVGTYSPDGVGVGEGWVVIASRSGLYMFDGGKPEKISQEIQPLWDRIYWLYGHTITVTVIPEKKKINIAVPMILPLPWEATPTSATPSVPNLCLSLDYVEGFGDPISGNGSGRKWSITEFANFGVNPSAQVVAEWSDLRTRLLVGGTSTLYFEDAATPARTDLSGTQIITYYETAPIGQEMGRSVFSILAGKIRGYGTLAASFFRPGGTETHLATATLSSAPNHDIELKINQTDTQLSFRIEAAYVANWFSMKRLGVWLKKAPFSYLRGHNL